MGSYNYQEIDGELVRMCRKGLHPMGKSKNCQPCAKIAKHARLGYDPDLCRKQLHPKSEMKERSTGQRFCPGCRDGWEKSPNGQSYRASQQRSGYSVKIGVGEDDEVKRKVQLTCGHEYVFKMCHLPKSWETPWCMACREYFQMVPVDQWKENGRLVRC
jgi:hypothetical protein